MTPTKTARALVAHPRWEWRPGMRVHGRRRLPDAWFRFEGERQHRLFGEWSLGVPDLADPATAGVLLAMVLEVLGPTGPGLGVEMLPNGHARLDWYDGEHQRTTSGDTLGHAAGLALLMLWGGE